MKKFLRKNLIGIIAIAVLIACGGAVSAGVSSQSPDRGDNPMVMESFDKKEVFPEGKGYYLSKAKAKEYQLPEKEQKQQQENLITGTSSDDFHGSTSSYSFGGSSSHGGFTPGKVVIAPSLKTNLDEKNPHSDVTGSKFTFYFECSLFGTKDFKEKDFTVTYGGETLEGDKGGSSSYHYSVKILEGEQKVQVALKYNKGKNTLKKTYKIIGTAEDEKTHKVSASGKMDTFDIELSDYSSKIKEGEEVAVSDIIKAMLGSKYKVKATEDDEITSISGFGKSVTLNSELVKQLEDSGYVDGVDFQSTVQLSDGCVANDGIFPEGSSLTGTWTIYQVEGESENQISYADTIKVKKKDINMEIILRYEIN